jgi:diphosphomevalonate decarboxylase
MNDRPFISNRGESHRLHSRAHALANLALVKYFGKRDTGRNLPAASSLSISLDPLVTETSVSFDADFTEDCIELNGVAADEKFSAKVSAFLDKVRAMAGVSMGASVVTSNHFPTAAGLASSASGFAALALAATDALTLLLSEQQLSVLARQGSGSAARSIPGGVAVWQKGDRDDGTDSYAYRIADPDDLDLRVVAGVSDPGPKSEGSTSAMERTRLTSPYFPNWIETVNRDLVKAVQAVERRDLQQLAEIAENNALAMHAAALAARPGILFWKGATVEAFHLTRRLRKSGVFAYFTCDAGPQPKVICTSADEPKVAEALSALPGIFNVIRCRIGGGAHILREDGCNVCH